MKRLKNQKILITGASGFLGSHLTQYLYKLGAKITVIVRYNSIEHNVRLIQLWDRINIYEADIRNIDSLKALNNEKYDYVFHLAAYNHVGNSFKHVGEALDTNSIGTANLLEIINHYKRFVYFSTSEVYGQQEPISFVEDMYPHPLSPYSIGKYAGELYALMKQQESGRPIVVVRPFNAFGPYQSTRAVIPELIIKCLRGLPVSTTVGKQTREFNFVQNLVDGIIKAALTEKAIGEIINLGSGEDIAICDLTNLIFSMTNSKSELQIGALKTRPNEIWKMRSNSTKAKELLNWEPTISFEKGLEITIEWFRNYLDVYYSLKSPLFKLNDLVSF